MTENPFPATIEKVCAGAQNQAQLVDEYAGRIRATRRTTTASILEECELCAHAEEALDDTHKRKLLEQISTDRTGFVKRVKVGRDDRLKAPTIRPLLPPHPTILYDLTLLDDGELSEAVSAKVLHADMKRDDLRVWIRNCRGSDQGRALAANVSPYVKIYLPIGMPTDDVEEFHEELTRLSDQYGVQAIFPAFAADERKNEQMNWRIDAYLRKRGRKRLGELRRQRLSGRPREINKSVWVRQKWPYSADQIAISAAADLDIIQEVLTLLVRRRRSSACCRMLIDMLVEHANSEFV